MQWYQMDIVNVSRHGNIGVDLTAAAAADNYLERVRDVIIMTFI